MSFVRSKFKKGASFFSTYFKGRASFDDAIFDGRAVFNNVVFDCDKDAKQSAKNKSFIITSSFNRTQFEDVAYTKTTFEAVIFKETIFHKVQFWESTFNSLADFESATFKSIDFFKVKFLNEAYFTKARFQGKGGFFWSDFADNVTFREASFENTCDFLINFTAFQKLIDFESANVAGYLSFNGSNDEKVFFDETDLKLEFIRIEDPDKVSFHTVELHPYWFINVDSRKFSFANVNWGRNFGKKEYETNELTRIINRGNNNSEQLFKITCRQLAENSENNNRFEEASKFRQIAFECERLERKEKISSWFEEPISCVSVFGKLAEKAKSFPYDLFHWLYRWSSGYGENRLWAFFVLFLIVSIPAILYTTSLCQFPNGQVGVRSLSFVESIAYSLRVMALQRPEPFPINDFGKLVLAVESVGAPLQLALFALAIRRKFMR